MSSNSKDVKMKVMYTDKQGKEGYHRGQEVAAELWKSGGQPYT